MLADLLWCIDCFQNHRNLNSDLYPRKSSGSYEKHFQGVSYNNFSNMQYKSSHPPLKLTVLLQGFKKEAYFPLYCTSYFCVKRIFALSLEERDLKSSAREERGVFQVIRVYYGLFHFMALKLAINCHLLRLLHLST